MRRIVEYSAQLGISVLTVFAFSSENWKRPRHEVRVLMNLFLSSLEEQVDDLHGHGVRLRFVGDRSAFTRKLQDSISRSEQKLSGNRGLSLVVAANYGGRWDITSACRTIAGHAASGDIHAADIDQTVLGRYLSTAGMPDPDLFIRTGGEQRISNFLLWDLAYTELYFTEVLWPDFTPAELDRALSWYAHRERRFGRIPDAKGQVEDD